MVLAASGDTWGIGGPTFLLAYLVIAAAVLVAGIRARRALADPQVQGPAGAVPDLASRPHDVAYLNGGAELAVYSALGAMHLRGTVAPSRGSVLAVGRLGPGADQLERAIHFTTAVAVQARRLPMHGVVRTALAATDQRLVDSGLLLSPEQRARIRRIGYWMLAVGGLGLVRLLAEIAEVEDVGFLVVALTAVAVVAAAQLAVAPRRTRPGDRVLRELRSEHHALAPEATPDWAAYGPASAALGIGIFGMSALWASDPAFADELAVQRTSAGGSGDGGGGYGGGYGGDGFDGGGGGCDGG